MIAGRSKKSVGRVRRFATLYWFILVLVVASRSVAAELAGLRSAAESITAKELQAHVDVLADDSFEGREAGTRGGHAAGGYLVKQLQSRGLKPAGDEGTYFQTFGYGYRNILGLLEGSDPELRREVIVVAAHYDHVGYGSRTNSFGPWGYVHNGADDNASGISGVLEVIDAVVAMGTPPRRSILFALFDGEEKGLLGSKQWAATPTLPWDRVAFMINCDMIGRLTEDRVEVFGSRTAYGLRRQICECNRLTNLKLDFTWELKDNSDHYSFFARNVPVMMLHTGLHNDYHRPSDDAHRLNAQGMQEVARLLFVLTYELADRPSLGKFRSEAHQEYPQDKDALESPLDHPAPRLGVVSEKTTGDKPIIRVAEVTYGTPAHRAGIEVGDRWVRFAGKPVEDLAQFRLDILTAKSPVDVEVERSGSEKPLTIRVELAGSPIRIGVSWREDAAETGTVVLAQVVYGSPAQLAGLAVGDRIYQVNDQTFRTGTELQQLLHTLSGPLKLIVERDGRLRTAVIHLQPVAPQSDAK